jgi:cytochrome c2
MKNIAAMYLIVIASLMLVGSAALVFLYIESTNFQQEPDKTVTTTIKEAEPASNLNPTQTLGKGLFEANCQSCHSIEQDITGPKLKDLEKRRTFDWFKKWVRNPSGMIKTDAYGRALATKWAPNIMTSFGGLTDADLLGLFEYIKAGKGDRQLGGY